MATLYRKLNLVNNTLSPKRLYTERTEFTDGLFPETRHSSLWQLFLTYGMVLHQRDFSKNFAKVLLSTLFAHFPAEWNIFSDYFSQIHCSPNSLDHRAYLASSIHLMTSGERRVRPWNLLAGGSWGTRWSRASSRRRMPTGCCRLARQPALTEAGSRLSKSVCWQLISCETTNTCSHFACGTLYLHK